MKRKTIILVIVLITTLSLNAQPWQWYEQSSGVSTQLNCVSSSPWGPTRFVWICGSNGVVIRTTNSGTNWLTANGGLPNTLNLTTICAIDSHRALSTGFSSGAAQVFRTTNAGINWTQVFQQLSGFINVLLLTSSSNVLMIGNPVGGRWSIWKSTNSGLSWDSSGLWLLQTGSETGFSNGYCYNEMRLWLGTNNFRIYYTTNTGINWTVQSTGPQKNSARIFFEWGGGQGLMGGDSLMFTTNYGTNWRYSPSLGTGRFGGIHGTFAIGIQDSVFAKTYYVRSDNKVYYKAYGIGSNWQVRYTAPSGIYTFMGRIASSFEVYSLRNNGGITKGWIEFEGAVKKISSAVPEYFALYQNYPNPFNPVTRIRFDIPAPLSSATGGIGEGAGVRLVIYNTLGTEIAVLVNEPLKPGSFEVTWNASKYASGVYFYKLLTKDFSETKKMVVMK